MKKVFLGLSMIGMVFMTSCKKDTDTIVAGEAQETSDASHDADVYAVNTDLSSTTWRGFKFFDDSTKPETGHHGQIKLKTGELMFKDGLLESGKLIADQSTLESIDLKDDEENKAKLEGHLKSGDFLDVDAFPEAVFEITGVKALDEGDYNTEISGNLDFRGVPKNISFKANVKDDGSKVTINSEEFKIDRQDFGIDFKAGAGTIIKDEVVLQLDVTAEKA